MTSTIEKINESWLSAYLFYADSLDQFLVECVKPFVWEIMENRLANQFHFIRYWDRGTHIRLRFKGDIMLLETHIKPSLKRHFESYFLLNPSTRIEPEGLVEMDHDQKWLANNSVQFVEYDPEITRYGGSEGILIAERQFEISSQAVLSILAESRNWDYTSAMGAAIQLHIGFIYALGMNLSEGVEFFDYVLQRWTLTSYGMRKYLGVEDHIQKKEEIWKMYKISYEKQAARLHSIFDTLWTACVNRQKVDPEWFNTWITRTSTFSGQLLSALQAHKLLISPYKSVGLSSNSTSTGHELWNIFDSYVHMTNNRLGILNRDEGYLAFILKEGLHKLL